MFEYYAGWADKQHGDVIPVPTTHLNYTLREPYGVVAQMTPWNAPVFTAGWQIAPAIWPRNAVVLKPSELTPVTSVVLARLIEEAGAPAGVVNVVAGLGPSAGHRLGDPPRRRQGRLRRFPRRPAVPSPPRPVRQLTPCVLELGGKSANIVFDDADLPSAPSGVPLPRSSPPRDRAAWPARGCWSNARSTTKSSSALAAVSQGITVGNPLDEVDPGRTPAEPAHS